MEEIFDRKMFNRLYFEWFQAVHERNREVAIEADKQVIPRLGKKMAQKIKEVLPGNHLTTDYMFDALKLSHWFQEDVGVLEKGEDYLVLYTKNCSFQEHWVNKFGDVIYCPASHGLFLEEFCKEINPKSKIENLLEPARNPKDDICCAWKISI